MFNLFYLPYVILACSSFSPSTRDTFKDHFHDFVARIVLVYLLEVALIRTSFSMAHNTGGN